MSAESIARETLLGVLPDGVPPSFVEIVSAIPWDGGRRKQIVVKLQMVDGLPATMVLTHWVLGWSHRFDVMPGGALSFEDGRWVRVDDDVVIC